MGREMERARDGQLVLRGQHGDKRALEELILLYQDTIFKLAFRMLGNTEDAADATQTTFLKAFENLKSFDPKFRFFSWIYRIAINECLNYRRRDRVSEYVDESIPDQSAGPELAARDSELQASVQAALMTLNDDHRAVITLRHFGELSYTEIASVLELPEKTVRSRLFEARGRLKSAMERAGVTAA